MQVDGEQRDGCQNRSEVVMDLSIFKIGGWNELQRIAQTSLEEFIDENLPWLLAGIPSRDPFLVQLCLETRPENSDQQRKIDVTS